jgi:hypothetical protein
MDINNIVTDLIELSKQEAGQSMLWSLQEESGQKLEVGNS